MKFENLFLLLYKENARGKGDKSKVILTVGKNQQRFIMVYIRLIAICNVILACSFELLVVI